MVPRGTPAHERKKIARRMLSDIKARQRAGLPDERLQIDPNEHDRIMQVLIKEGRKSRLAIPGRPDLSALTQEDYWMAVERGL